ncbi:MAG: hypothetical protein GTO71_02160 [Woeseiaceae bacterium]|nr:hypothetical protein [Woeseiaceae bacterium]NIP19914.1 hypothetical protein [Woeseiaceae bacterium]NIS88715.1 hypothetical protein [Woeseiaceae bacterium]
MNHRVGRFVFAFGVGLIVAFLSYQWITNPAPGVERQLQEAAVAAARKHLETIVAAGDIRIVDPLAPDRKVGKTYIYRAGDGWEVSGYYQRNEDDRWHPYLVTLDAAHALIQLKVQDPALVDNADPRIEVLP